MDDIIRLRPFAVLLAVSFLALLSTSVATGEDRAGSADKSKDEEKTWDQQAVTKLANELEQTLQEAYEGSLKAPRQRTALQQRERDAAQSVIRRARDRSQEYAQRMREGWDRDTSEPYFRVVAGEVAHIFDTAGDAKPTASAAPTIERFRRLLDELRLAYDGP